MLRPLVLPMAALLAAVLMATSPHATRAQETYTLQDCIDRVLAENLQLQQQKIQQEIAAAGFRQGKLNYMPDLSGNWSFSRNYGTSFDPFSFQRVDQTTDFSSPSLSLNLPLFSGFAKYYTLKRSTLELQAATATTQQVQNDLITQVMLAYLQLTFDRSNLAITEDRIGLLEDQMEITRAQFEAGTVTEVQVRNLEAQLALEEVAQVNQQNQVARDELQLKLLLRLPPEDDIEFQPPADPSEDYLSGELPPVTEVEGYALMNMPQVIAPRLRLQAAEAGIQSAKAAFYPTLSFNASIGSNYTSNGGIPVYDTETINIQGQEIPISRELIRVERDAYFQQLEDNLNQTLGLTLRIPILSRGQRLQSLEVARLQRNSAALSVSSAEQELQNTIRRAHFDAVAARKRYAALQTQVEAFRRAYELTEKQYSAGQVGFFDLRDALNGMTQAKNELEQARADYLFKRKILEFYGGQALELE